jgi:hypothetical protein
MRRQPDNIGRENISIIAVKIIDQEYNGKMPRVNPIIRREEMKIQEKKFIADKKLDIPEINKPNTMRSTATGDKLIKDVLNGGYKVQPRATPNSDEIDKNRKKYEKNKKIKVKLLSLG